MRQPNHPQLADPPLQHRPAHRVRLRVRAVHEAFHEEAAVLAGGVEHFLGLGEAGGEGFFAEDVLAGGEGFEGPFVVHGVGEGDVDGLDARIGGRRQAE